MLQVKSGSILLLRTVAGADVECLVSGILTTMILALDTTLPENDAFVVLTEFPTQGDPLLLSGHVLATGDKVGNVWLYDTHSGGVIYELQDPQVPQVRPVPSGINLNAHRSYERLTDERDRTGHLTLGLSIDLWQRIHQDLYSPCPYLGSSSLDILLDLRSSGRINYKLSRFFLS